MATDKQQLFQNALSLNADDRAELADLLWATLEETDPEIERLWIEEAKRRVAAYQSGEMETLSYEQFFRGLEKT